MGKTLSLPRFRGNKLNEIILSALVARCDINIYTLSPLNCEWIRSAGVERHNRCDEKSQQLNELPQSKGEHAEN